jgi:hypothetical protein
LHDQRSAALVNELDDGLKLSRSEARLVSEGFAKKLLRTT